MYTLRIGHSVSSFEGWKQAFDNDPVGRQKSRVRRHQVFRAIDDPNYVMIDLEFETAAEAEAMLASLHNLWRHVEGGIMMNPQTRIVEAVEVRDY